MGTPDFAVGILDAVYNAKHEIVCIVTAADKPAGRGQKIKFSAVKEYSLRHNLKLLQPTNLKDDGFLSELKGLNANLHIVVAFRMLPKVVWEMPKYGTFNLHASLLPNYRGAAPINWAIINGESKTGVTTFFIDDKIDTGAMILSKELLISENENAGFLHDRLMILGAETVLETLDLIANQKVDLTIQNDEAEIKTAYKLNKDNCKIDWNQPGKMIHNQIRGLSPYPASWCFFTDGEQEWNVKIYESEINIEAHQFEIGKILATKKELKIATLDGFIIVKSLQFPGKKKISAQELLNGMSFSENSMAN